jgi:signal transduction histidine kinase
MAKKELLLCYSVTLCIFYLVFFLVGESFQTLKSATLYSFVLVLLYYAFQVWMGIHRTKKIQSYPILIGADLSFGKLATAEEKALVEVIQLQNEEHAAQISRLKLEREQLNDTYTLWSHQIKVPLSVIDLMLQTNELDPGILKHQVNSMKQYIEMILQFNRIGREENDFRFENVDLNSLVQESVKKYAHFFIQKDLSVEIIGVSTVQTDKKWLQFVFEQLLFNALKYTDTGGIHIHLSADELWIEDTGIGILEEDIPRLLEPGFTGYNGRLNKNSSGLGLNISKKILDKLNYHLEIESTVGTGSRFHIVFAPSRTETIDEEG